MTGNGNSVNITDGIPGVNPVDDSNIVDPSIITPKDDDKDKDKDKNKDDGATGGGENLNKDKNKDGEGGDAGAGDAGAGDAGAGGEDPKPFPSEVFANDNGDVIDAEGNILIEKANVKFDEEGKLIVPDTFTVEAPAGDGGDEGGGKDESVINAVVEFLENDLGANFVKNGEKMKFEETGEGFAQLAIETAKQMVVAERAAEDTSMPIVAKFREYVRSGQNPENFFSVSNKYRTMVLPESTNDSEMAKTARRDIVRQSYIEKSSMPGMTADQIALIKSDAESYVNMVEDGGKLTETAKNELARLQYAEKFKEEQRDANAAAANDAAAAQEVKFWESTKKTLETGKLGNLTMNKDDVPQFWNYLTKKNVNGATQEMIDHANEDKNFTLQLAYMRFLRHKYPNKNIGFETLVNMMANEKRVLSLKKKKLSLSVAGKGQGRTITPGGNVNLDDITVENIWGGKPKK